MDNRPSVNIPKVSRSAPMRTILSSLKRAYAEGVCWHEGLGTGHSAIQCVYRLTLAIMEGEKIGIHINPPSWFQSASEALNIAVSETPFQHNVCYWLSMAIEELEGTEYKLCMICGQKEILGGGCYCGNTPLNA